MAYEMLFGNQPVVYRTTAVAAALNVELIRMFCNSDQASPSRLRGPSRNAVPNDETRRRENGRPPRRDATSPALIPSSRMKRLVILIAAYVVLCLAGGAFVADRALQRPRQPTTPADREQAGNLARTLGARLETVSIVARDGVTLQGWLFTPRRPNSHSVVLLHGVTSNRAAMLTLVRLFVEHGYRSLAVDARAHGDSGGELGTFGVREADDLRQWIATIPSGAPDGCVYAFGQSLGAALALQAADTPGLCAVVAESGFASLREIAFDRIGQKLRTGPWAGRILLRPGVELAFLYARIRYGLDLATASAVASVARPGVPILLIHGMEDDNTPVRHARIIHAANPSRVSTWLVPGGSHVSAGRATPAEYSARVMGFLAMPRGARP